MVTQIPPCRHLLVVGGYGVVGTGMVGHALGSDAAPATNAENPTWNPISGSHAASKMSLELP